MATESSPSSISSTSLPPLTDSDYTLGLTSAVDILPGGPIRTSQSTHDECEVKQMRYARELALQWVELMKEREKEKNDGVSRITPEQTQYLLTNLIPILVEALSSLLRAYESSSTQRKQQAKQQRKNPSLKPYEELVPLEFLAAYLARHNPKYAAVAGKKGGKEEEREEKQQHPATKPNPITQIYAKTISGK